ncbi:MAG: hypothetical protein Q8P68_03020 [Candidatus Peregrinibacteria bacterium]|nr:hypothetical protein [Candidatus Peregrinibacteria bacterium]MDZ4244705.1 hypothetical protein [Candidatus Gracilibacteria bacterium]
MEISLAQLRRVRRLKKEYYDSIRCVFCPYFAEEVTFNSKGFMHLIYIGPRKERDRVEQYLRLKLLEKGVAMLKIATVVQEYEERILDKKIVRFWGFIGIIEGAKIKVIVRQEGAGKKHFYSIFPKWTTRNLIEK